MLISVVFGITAMAGFTVSAVDLSQWSLKMPLTISGYTRSAVLTNFPVLVTLNSGISGFHYSDFQSGSNADLRFTDATQTNELNYEVDQWDTTGNSYVWVQIPRLTNNTSIRMFWGKAGVATPAYATNGAAWSANYLSVYHLNRNGSAIDLRNAAGNTNNLVNGGGATSVSGGRIGYGAKFDGGTNDTHYLTVPNYVGFPTAGNPYTVSAWVNMTVTNPAWRVLLGVNETNSAKGISLRDNATVTLCANTYNSVDNFLFADSPYSTGQWYYVSMRFDGTKEHLYINGVPQGGGSGTSVTQNYSGAVELDLAREYSTRGGGVSCFTVKCMQDEVRVSTVARSTNWVWAEWMTMASNSVFYSNGSVEFMGGTAVSNVGASNVTSSAATLYGVLSSTGLADTAVFVFYGTTDGGTNAANWAAMDASLAAPQSVGTKSVTVSVDTSQQYFFRYAASNSAGMVWVPSSQSFTTPVDLRQWSKKMQVQFSGYNRGETLTNFPVLVTLGTNISGFSYSDFLSGANADLRFADASQTNELNYEIDQWDTNGNSYVWVQVPKLASYGSIWACWGKAGQNIPAYTTNGATWSNGYLSVYHLNGNGSTVGLKNSASTANYLTNGGGASNSSAGRIGCGVKFDGGTNDGHYLAVPNMVGFPTSGAPFTVSAWVNMTVTNPVWRGLLGVNETNSSKGISLRDNATLKFCADTYNGTDAVLFADSTYTTGQWYYVSMPFDGSKEFLTINGSPQGGGSGLAVLPNYSGALEFNIARQYSSRGGGALCFTLKCQQDEVRISTVARSTNWVWAEWMNMASNSTFAANGMVASGSAASIVTRPATNVTSTTALLSGWLFSSGESAAEVYVYWGLTDGGTNASDWAHSRSLGTQTSGAISTGVSGLDANSLYYYRHQAINAGGTAWSPGAVSFSTAVPRGPIFRFW